MDSTDSIIFEDTIVKNKYRLLKRYPMVKCKTSRKTLKILIVTLLFIIMFLFGVYVGHITTESNLTMENYRQHLSYFNEPSFSIFNDEKEFLSNQINVENLKKHLKYLSSIPHTAGTDGDKISADYVYNQFKSYGLDVVTMNDYNVLLDYSDNIEYNNIEIRDKSNNLISLYEIKEEIYDLELNYTNIPKPFLAYSLSGSFSSDELYYANFCDIEDFAYLVQINISVENKTVLCRYGGIFRGNKIKNAEKFGARGVLLYDDPKRCAPSGFNDINTYPTGEFMPSSGTQRGTIYVKEGDPLTPIYPSTETCFRIDEDEQEALPKIHAQVIGYGVAMELFKLIYTESSSRDLPSSWKGDLPINYTYGGVLAENRTISINIFNKRKLSKIYNVIGVMKGTIEPDRYVIVGNHRDAWTFGAVDPTSGTSSLIEISRSLAKLRNSSTVNWKPKRSIIFISWSAEEYGLIGSTEWVEEFEKKLISNGVIYINADMSVQGNYSYDAKASPLLFNLIYETTKSIKINSTNSVFDRWLENNPNKEKNLPRINPFMGSNSDHMAFLQRAGIPCIDHRFIKNKKNPQFKNIIGSYPLYHTSYETFKLIDKFIDPNYQGMRQLTTIMAQLAFNVSSTTILPFDTRTYVDELNYELKNLKRRFQSVFGPTNISLNGLERSIENLKLTAINFHSKIKSIDKKKYYLVRQFNEQLRNFERAFLDFSNLHETSYLHTIYAPSSTNKYAGTAFPLLVDSIINYNLTIKNNTENSVKQIKSIKKQLAAVIYSIDSASSILKEPFDFSRGFTGEKISRSKRI